MVNKTFKIPLDLKVPSASYDVEVVEGDNGNIFVISLTDDGEAVDLSGCKVLAVFSRPDGATVQQDTDGHGITIGGDDNNIVTIDLYTGSFSPGTVPCELQVYSGLNQATLATSAQFTFQCRRSIMNDDTILSEEKYPILVALIRQVTELASTIASAIADAARRVQANWTQTDTASTDFIKNKPATFAPSTHADNHAAGEADEFLHATQHAYGAADAIRPASIGAEYVRLQFTDTAVATAAFIEEDTPTYADFPYRAAVVLAGVLANMTPEVVFDVSDALSGNFAPVAACYDDGVYIYASEPPEASITIPTIICWREVV